MKTKRITKRIISLVLAFVLVLGEVPLPFMPGSMEAHAAGNVSYLDEKGVEQTAVNPTEVTDDDPNILGVYDLGEYGETTWYVVNGEVTISRRVTVHGDVNLILADGAKLTIVNNPENSDYGIYIATNSGSGSLNIFSQSTGTGQGQLNVTAQTGIGVSSGDGYTSSLNINGGIITVSGTRGSGVEIFKNGSMIVNNGDVTVNGSEADDEYDKHDAINDLNRLQIYGGTVKADGDVISESTVPYLDADGKQLTAVAPTEVSADMLTNEGLLFLGDSEETTRYVVKEDVTIYGQLTIRGNVNLILADGKELTVVSSGNDQKGIDIADDSSLNIYTQSHDNRKGKLTVTSGGIGVEVGDGSLLTINGGVITASGQTRGLNISAGSVTVNSGQVTLTNNSVTEGVQIQDGGTLTLGYNSAKDFFRINGISHNELGTVRIRSGQTLTDGLGNAYNGTLSGEQLTALAGRKLVPAYAVNITECDGGTVTADKRAVAFDASNKTVTLTLTPDAGYAVKSVSAGSREVTKVNDTTYTFVMGEEDVEVSAVFALIPASAPRINTQPADLALTTAYTEGSLSVSATVAGGHTLSYQWYSCEDRGRTGPAAISGATDAAYTIPTGKASGTTEYYYCVVTATRTDNGQTETQTSDVAMVTVRDHVHRFTYTASGATITASCSSPHCYLDGNKATVTIEEPLHVTYGDGKAAEAGLSGDTDEFGDLTILYKKGTEILDAAPVTPGTYTASITVGSRTASISYAIAKKPVTISGVTVSNKVYDGTTAATISGTPVVEGKVGDDDVRVTVGRASFASADAGEGIAVTFSGFALSGSDADHYTLSAQPEGGSADITKAPAVTIADIALNKLSSAETIRASAAGKMPSDAGTLSYTKGSASKTGEVTVSSWDIDEDGKISLSISGGEAGDTITLPVTIGSTNYADSTVNVIITLGDKEDAGVSVRGVTGGAKTVTYGDPKFTLSGAVTAAGEGTGVWTWSSSDSSVAEIAEHSGEVTIKKAGSTTITAQYESDTTIGEAAFTLTVDPMTLGISWSNTSFTYDRSSHKPTATLSGVKDGDADVCNVSVSGAQTNAGTYTATASLSGAASGNYRLPEDKTSCSFTINPASIAQATITLGTALTYNGSEQTQTVSKVELNGTNILNYCEVTNNKGTNAGNYTLTVTAKQNGNYTGSKTAAFTIAKKAVTPTVNVSGTYTYTGTAITPEYTVKAGGTELAETDYTVSLSDNLHAGKGKLTVTAAAGGNYSFEPVTTEFTIAKAAHENATAAGEAKYGYSGTVELAGLIEEGGSFGTLSVSDVSGVLEGTPSISGTTLSFRFKDVEENKNKTAAVTIPVQGCTDYLDYSITATLTVTSCAHENTELRGVKEANCTEDGYSGDTYCADCGKKLAEGSVQAALGHAFDEGVVVLAPTAYVEGIRECECTRCGVKKQENIEKTAPTEEEAQIGEDAGEGGVVSSTEPVKDEEGNVTGSTTTVAVGGKEVETITVNEDGEVTYETDIWIGGLQDSYAYTGAAIKPEIRVYDGLTLLGSSDYAISYKDNTKPGTATLTVSFKGNYKKTEKEKLSFTIVPAVLGTDVTAADLAVAVSGKVQKPVPALTFAANGKKADKKNFEFRYSKDGAAVDGITEAGIYSVTVIAKNVCFTGSTTAAITATADKKLLLSEAKVTLKTKKVLYTGEALTLPSDSYTLVLDGATLTEGSDFSVSYANNTEPGKATITFTAVEGNEKGLVGSKSASFTIAKGRELKPDGDFSYSFEETVPYMKGGAKPSVTVKDGEEVLTEGVDYSVSYKKNTAVTDGKTAEMTVKGKGVYKGSVTLYFAVTGQELAALDILATDKVASDKGWKNPTVTVTDLNGKKLKAGKDYQLDAESYVVYGMDGKEKTEAAVGDTVTVCVKGLGCYSGSTSVSYRYIEAGQNIAKLKAFKLKEKEFDGHAVTLTKADLTGIFYTGGKDSPVYLVPGEDFEVVSYTKNEKTGTAKVTVRGIGKWGGTKTLSFKIKAKKGEYKGALVDGEWQ